MGTDVIWQEQFSPGRQLSGFTIQTGPTAGTVQQRLRFEALAIFKLKAQILRRYHRSEQASLWSKVKMHYGTKSCHSGDDLSTIKWSTLDVAKIYGRILRMLLG